MCLSSPNAPAAPAAVAEAPTAPDSSRGGTAEDRDRQRRAAASGGSSRSTILTGSRGVQNGTATATKTLLGS